VLFKLCREAKFKVDESKAGRSIQPGPLDLEVHFIHDIGEIGWNSNRVNCREHLVGSLVLPVCDAHVETLGRGTAGI
jgi:hypothetical protein